MIRHTLLLALLCVVLAAPAGAAVVQNDGGSSGSSRCGTVDLTRDQTDAAQAAIDQYKALHGGPRIGTIQVALHIITCDGVGDLTQTQIDQQMRELNSAYRGTGFAFELTSVDRTENCLWFRVSPGTGNEKKMKEALAIDPAHHMNVYTVNPGHNLLGWAYFPQSFPEDYFMHGVVIHYGSLPGGIFTNYSLGGTLDHEAGHYLGLYHTFQGGCTPPGDYVDDTPFEGSPAFGCPIGRNTCPQPGDDPIHNYMDYTYDACYSEFTFGQADRMQFIVPIYRPSLLQGTHVVFGGASGADAIAASGQPGSGAIAFRGAWPNPFSRETALHFTLARAGHVSIELYNVAGQFVKTLVDGELSAGEQTVALRAGTLPPGMYFATLRGGNEAATRSVVLLP